jgi:hypothetical protein
MYYIKIIKSIWNIKIAHHFEVITVCHIMYYVGKTPTWQLNEGTGHMTLQTISIVRVIIVVNHIVCAELSLLFHRE